MKTLKKRINFLESTEGNDTLIELENIQADAKYNTTSSFSANSTQYPDNQVPFVEKHMNYLNTHPLLEIRQYLANIRLKTRIR